MTWIDPRLDVWHDDVRPSVQVTGGSQRVTTEDPPDDWTPPAPVGFAPPVREPDAVVEPLTWDGDQG